MNATSFEEWFNEELLPALPPNIIIVIDNASYHRYRDYTTRGVGSWLLLQSSFGETLPYLGSVCMLLYIWCIGWVVVADGWFKKENSKKM